MVIALVIGDKITIWSVSITNKHQAIGVSELNQ